jgi:hypothetical protein
MVGMGYGSWTFAAHLKQFSRTVDIVDKATFDGVRDLIVRYVRRELGERAYFELLRDRPVDGGLVLDTLWSSEDRKQFLSLHHPDGKFETAAAMSFAREKPLWVVALSGEPLDSCPASECQDQWSQVTDLPAHRSPTNRPMKTLITLPLRSKRPLGLFYLESPHLLVGVEEARNEISMLGGALATLLELWELHETGADLTGEAVQDLQDMVMNAQFPRLTRPQVFVAHSMRADARVTDVMREVLRKYKTRIDVTYWSDINEAGNVTTQIGEKIVSSRFGICYLSEPAVNGGSGTRYVDNPNVVFEAGMLHALANAPSGPPSGWIPIRERESPPAPFDFAHERILEVARSGTGEVAPNFETDFQARMDALLSPKPPVRG